MSFGEVINTIIIAPLQLIFEVVFILSNKIVQNPGVSIVALSLVMNFLLLPLYMRADALQEEERNTEKKLRDGVAHIKKYFSGNERMMMLQTYYRQNDYKPTYVLRGAASLFLEIPFFIAAYRFLSGLQLLQGVPFGPISDLGKPDGLLILAGATINLLPIIMTAINLITCIIFTKGATLKSKIQLYGMAIFFLVFLYKSPAGLVFYWTLNNLFSLKKTIFYKLKNPGKILAWICSLSGIAFFAYGVLMYPVPTLKKTVFFAFCLFAMQTPLVFYMIKRKQSGNLISKSAESSSNKKLFFVGSLFLSALVGLLIPSEVIKSSPQELVDLHHYYNPLRYLFSSFCIAFGTFVIWLGVFYNLAKPKAKEFLDRAIWVVSGVAIVNYMFFGKNLGIINSNLQFENGIDFSFLIQLHNLVVVGIVALILYIFSARWQKQSYHLLQIFCVAIIFMSIINLAKISGSIRGLEERAAHIKEQKPNITLSKEGKNVIVLMLDRAMAAYVPYMLNEKPELYNKFSGFKYYSNVISFGSSTNFAVPALFGGYEYTPMEINKRGTETLVSKHNEALKVLPLLFLNQGYEVTVCDPPYANYEWIPDLSIYDEYPSMKTYILKGKFSNISDKEGVIKNNKRNFFCYGIFKTFPLFLQELFYDKGNYLRQNSITEEKELTSHQDSDAIQTITGNFTANGLYSSFVENYLALANLSSITTIKNQSTNTLLLMTNDLPHDPMMLQEPDYVPKPTVDNTEYEAQNKDRFTVNGRTMDMRTGIHYSHYQTNMASMLLLGKWFDFLRENGVYDNTRIIIVADHGGHLFHFDDLVVSNDNDACGYYPLLMVKDFNDREFSISDEFMTNADVPTIVTKEIISEPRNPFTGKLISSNEKLENTQYLIYSTHWNTKENNGNTFLPARWYSVSENVLDVKKWKLVAEDSVLP